MNEFVVWAEGRIFQGNGEDKSLTRLLNVLFQTVYYSLFTWFLRLRFLTSIQDELEQKNNFYPTQGGSVSHSWRGEKTEEEIEQEISETRVADRKRREQETIEIILKFSSLQNWKVFYSYSRNPRNESLQNNLELLKAEIRSKKIDKIFQGDEFKQLARERIVGLIDRLLSEITKGDKGKPEDE